MTSRHIFVLGSVNNQRDKRGEIVSFLNQNLCFISFFYAHNLLIQNQKLQREICVAHFSVNFCLSQIDVRKAEK